MVIGRGVLDEAAVAEIRDQAREAVRSAVREANAAPDADPGDLLAGVFATVTP